MRIKTGRVLSLLLSLLALLAAGCSALLNVTHGPSIYQYAGVNLAGAEFTPPDKRPGAYQKDYIYPTQAEVDYFLSKGFNTFRLPFSWENLQPTPIGDLDPGELARLDQFVQYATGQDAYVILDPHNYARYHDHVLGSPEAPAALLVDLWRRLAEHYAGDPHVIFGLMNEPHDLSADDWLKMANQTLAAIREAGADNLVLVPGSNYTKAISWGAGEKNGNPNGLAMLDISDPSNNYAYELHNYLDADSSGRSPTCASARVGVERLADITAWLRNNHRRAFLAEFGAGSDPTCLAALDQMLAHIAGNGDVWLGWTYWAAGPWWHDYPLSIEPVTGADAPQLAPLLKHLPPPPPTNTPEP
jgi:endoglucanase